MTYLPGASATHRLPNMTEIRSLCVFCGSREGRDPVHRSAAVELGRLIAARGMRLVYGGGTVGLMGVVADSVLAAGGAVTGVIPDFLVKEEAGNRQLDDLIITGSMHDRKRRMFELSDAFVVLPGGLGTLDETIEIITWKQLRLHDAPIIVLDIGAYWRPLHLLIDAVCAGGFADPGTAGLISVVQTPEAVFEALAAAPVPREQVPTSHL